MSPNIIRIRNLQSETLVTPDIYVPVDKDTYTSNAKKLSLSDIAAYVIYEVDPISALTYDTWTGDLTLETLYGEYVTNIPICGTTFTNIEPVPETIGGIEAGTTFPDRHTMQEMWDLLLYPYQYPAFTQFYIDGVGVDLEIGNGFPVLPNTTETFKWTISNPATLSGNSISITGYNLIPLSNLSNDGEEIGTFTATVTRDNVGTRSWTISAKNNLKSTFSRNFTVTWNWMWYWGSSDNIILNETEIKNLDDSELISSYLGTFQFDATPTNTYKYICFANDANYTPGPISFIDEFTGFGIAMNGDYDNIENGISYALTGVTNSYGKNINYRIYRTREMMSGDINIIVS